MATTLTITNKTYTGLSGTCVKTDDEVAILIISPGLDKNTIYDNYRADRSGRMYDVGHPGNYNWSFSSSEARLIPNTQYGVVVYFGASIDSPVYDGTLPPAPTSIALAPGISDIGVHFTTQTDGGYYTKQIQYSIDSGVTWVTAATVNTGSATDGSFVIPGLNPGTLYTVMTRTTTTAGTTLGASLTTRTRTDDSSKFYGSVGGEAVMTTKFYGSVGGQATQIKLYGSVNGQAKRIY